MDASPATPQQNSSSHSANNPPPHTSTSTNAQSSSSASGPQIRSRITVVCAECKRLKLKCDRRNPCGSCTKRDTVARCIYSPAAAEKVDLHSLNNRLIQVETALAQITAGQGTPAFQSSYPFSQPSGSSSISLPIASSSSHLHQHHHHTAAPLPHDVSDGISLSPTDLSSIWLEDLDLDVPLPYGVSLNGASSSGSGSGGNTNGKRSSNSRRPSVAGHIKLEPSPVDVDLSARRNGTIHIDADESRRGTGPSPAKRQRLQSQQTNAHLLLPPWSIYYPVASISPPSNNSSPSAAFPHHPSSSNSPSHYHSSSSSTGYTFPTTNPPSTHQPLPSSHSQSSSHHPRTTPALIALLPSLPVCVRLLERAGEVLRMRPVPMGTKGFTGFEKRCFRMLSPPEKKEKEKEARKARAIFFPTQTATLDELGEEDDEESLTLFASLCAVLALGALMSPAHSLSSTSSGPASERETPAFLYALSQQAVTVWDAHRSSSASPATSSGDVREESEKMDYLLACLVGVVYLMLLPGEKGEEGGGVADIFPLVGKMVNIARGMGLGSDSESGGGSAAKKAKDRRSSVNLSLTSERGKEREKEREETRRMVWWDVVFYDLFTSDTLGHPALIPPFSYSTKLPECAAVQAEEDEESDSDDQDEVEETRKISPRRVATEAELERDRYFGARCRLTQIAQTVKHRISHPDCCCGYTLDQAATLEGEVRRFLGGLPSILRFSVNTSSESAFQRASSLEPGCPYPMDDISDQEKESEKTILQAQSAELYIMANQLIIKIYTPFLRPSSASSSVNAWSPASQSTVTAAQAILRASKALQAILKSPPPSSSMAIVPPAMLDFYPFKHTIFSSVVIAAHAATTGKASSFDTGVVDDLTSGMELMSELASSDEAFKVVDALKKRLTRGVNLLKRKHDQVDLLNKDRAVGGDTPPGILDIPTYPMSNTSPQDLSLPAPPRSDTSLQKKDSTSRKSTSEKDKKHAKKHPSVGIRVRPNGLAARVRTQSGSTNSSGGNADNRGSMRAPPLLTSAPRTAAVSNDAGMGYTQSQQPQSSSQPPQQPQSQAPPPQMIQDDYRSRSSSVNQRPPSVHDTSTGMDYTMAYGGPSAPEMNMQRRYSTHELPPQQHHQQPQPQHQQSQQPQQLSPQSQPYNSPPFEPIQSAPHSYDQPQPHSSYDQGHSAPADSTTYGSTSSPYQNSSGPLSSTGSPYTTGSVPPASGIASHHPSPPSYQSGSPSGYFVGSYDSNSYDNSSNLMGPPQSISLSGLPMDTSSLEHAANSMAASIPSTPVYDKPQQAHYDVKPPMDSVHHHSHMMQPSPQFAEHHHSVAMGGPHQQSWSTSPQQLVQPVSVQGGQPYWGSGNDYKYYPS